MIKQNLRCNSVTGLVPGNIRALFVVCIAIGLFGLATKGTAAETAVAVDNFNAPTDMSDKTVPVFVWYPTTSKAKVEEFGIFKMKVAKDGEIKQGSYGLIVISHGWGGSHLGHRSIAQYLAARGYVVAAPLHPFNNYTDNPAEKSFSKWSEIWSTRPQDIADVIDAMLGHRGIGPSIDKSRIGVIGHSTGGYTALTAAGGVPNLANYANHCGSGDDRSFYCAAFQYLPEDAKKTLANSENLEGLRDDRIAAAALLAPIGAVFGEGSLSEVKVPVAVYRAGQDDVLLHPSHSEKIVNLLPVDAHYVVTEEAGHYSYISPFPDEIRASVGPAGSDPVGFDRSEFLDELNVSLFDFFEGAFQ